MLDLECDFLEDTRLCTDAAAVESCGVNKRLELLLSEFSNAFCTACKHIFVIRCLQSLKVCFSQGLSMVGVSWSRFRRKWTRPTWQRRSFLLQRYLFSARLFWGYKTLYFTLLILTIDLQFSLCAILTLPSDNWGVMSDTVYFSISILKVTYIF